jgi:hypothetical protein
MLRYGWSRDLSPNPQGVEMGNSKPANDNKKPSLTFSEAVDVWLRHWGGEFQHAIAAHYAVNQGRVNEVLKEKKHVGSKQVAEGLWKKPA